jgi:toxin ParE1/3/4
MTYRLTAPARIEYKQSIQYYLKAAGSAIAYDFDEAVAAALDLICAAPFQDKLIAPDVREKLLDGFPFSIIYSVEDDEVVVLAIKHHRRRPDYWKTRVI